MRRPCFSRRFRCIEELRAKREACERMRTDNAAKRDKTLLKAYRKAVRAAAAESNDKEVLSSSICGNLIEVSVAGGLGELGGKTAGEVGGETDTGPGTGIKKAEVSPSPAASKSTPKPKHHHHHEVDAKKAQQQRQAKSCTGPEGMIDEGVSLASDGGDVARIHAANRKAWPRGQEPIAADTTAEEREVAELVRRGFIGVEDLRVDYDGFGGDECLYTVRFVEARKKGRKGNNRQRQGVQVAELAPFHAESDWWYLDDKAYTQLLSDGEAEWVDWSEASSFVLVD